MQQYFSNQVYVFCFHPWENNRGTFLILKTIKLDRILWGNFFFGSKQCSKGQWSLWEEKHARSWLPDRARFWTLAQGAAAQPRQQSHWAEEVECRAGHQGRGGCMSPRLKTGSVYARAKTPCRLSMSGCCRPGSKTRYSRSDGTQRHGSSHLDRVKRA